MKILHLVFYRNYYPNNFKWNYAKIPVRNFIQIIFMNDITVLASTGVSRNERPNLHPNPTASQPNCKQQRLPAPYNKHLWVTFFWTKSPIATILQNRKFWNFRPKDDISMLFHDDQLRNFKNFRFLRKSPKTVFSRKPYIYWYTDRYSDEICFLNCFVISNPIFLKLGILKKNPKLRALYVLDFWISVWSGH